MANKSKMQDPADAALSAIEEALNLSTAASQTPDKEPAQLPKADEGFNFEVEPEPQEPPAAAPRAEDKPAADRPLAREPRSPANDDRASVGQLLQALQRRPSRTPYWTALALSVVWLAGGALLLSILGNLNLANLFQASTYQANPGLALGILAVVLPPFFFFAVAGLIWRSQEMRFVTRSMTQVALRLAEPEGAAAEAVTSVGQAIRREVAAMGDGIDRALARASELEIMVHNEVSMLERSYTESEQRIRSLVDDLSTQREAIVGNADRVRSAIVVAHDDLTLALGSVAGRISSEVSEAGLQVMRSFGERGSQLTSELAKTSIGG